MNPILSPDDTRLVTLLGVTMDTIGELALRTGNNPEEILAKALYRANKRIHEIGTERTMNELTVCYPLLKEAIS